MTDKDEDAANNIYLETHYDNECKEELLRIIKNADSLSITKDEAYMLILDISTWLGL